MGRGKRYKSLFILEGYKNGRWVEIKSSSWYREIIDFMNDFRSYDDKTSLRIIEWDSESNKHIYGEKAQ